MDKEADKYLDVLKSWKNHLFNFNIAVPHTNTPGLRRPQLAAIW